jgi:hypothetical protein
MRVVVTLLSALAVLGVWSAWSGAGEHLDNARATGTTRVVKSQMSGDLQRESV